jgi:hypothetical protein
MVGREFLFWQREGNRGAYSATERKASPVFSPFP